MTADPYSKTVPPDINALEWACEHFILIDRANAAMHCAAVRYSPITFRLCALLSQLENGSVSENVSEVMADFGSYAWDFGR